MEQSTKQLSAGDKAPNFNLTSHQGNKSLSDYAGKWLVLYFYPKDDTPGCTTEACDFRDMQANAKMKAEILGVSADDAASHEKFASKYSLSFPLLVDEDNALAKAYGAYGEKTMFGKKHMGILRSTFIINPQGNIAEAMYNVQATGHAERVAEKLLQLQSA